MILLVLLGVEGYTQSSEYTYTPDGSLLFADVVEKEEQNQQALYALAVQEFSKGKKNKIRKNEDDKTISLSKSFTLFEKGILSRIPYSEIQYQLLMEFKDGRYRYQYKDFAFLPYERNRYGKYEVVQRKRKSLEDVIQNDQVWSKYNEEFANRIQAEIEDIIRKMNVQVDQPKEDSASNVIHLDKEW
ncbi:hypothetical protein [Catalinimonas niigatensis]|uniref:hypothetical protein n=1 Tax=Catalinimonas niigatensis TaxID=1397264 RepID=UPI002665006C|nr:hypothetical protein [Catalinimonas niigatensis]WPP50318.1 hypothetical protein PZB72_26995 [Catalinimonas niigatensis]